MYGIKKFIREENAKRARITQHHRDSIPDPEEIDKMLDIDIESEDVATGNLFHGLPRPQQPSDQLLSYHHY